MEPITQVQNYSISNKHERRILPDLGKIIPDFIMFADFYLSFQTIAFAVFNGLFPIRIVASFLTDTLKGLSV
jgi:hypothetical protein